ncbi:hypothetical protein AAF712_015257 [Marasmius tenuissimus]|uniref:Cytochrome P450 n=1 Tax=Marasmius tenuissimus TaxID=585030 RepID=A0ABR2Z9V0_9AGAR
MDNSHYAHLQNFIAESEWNWYKIGLGTFVAYCGFKYLQFVKRRGELSHIPTLGSSSLIPSYFTAYKFFREGRNLISAGVQQFPGGVFKVPTFDGWQVIVHGRGMLEDLKRANEEDLSVLEAFVDLIKSDYTMSPTILRDPYHVDVVRTPLTRNIGARFDDVCDELAIAFNENLPSQEDGEWHSPPGDLDSLAMVQNIVVRASNRLLVGLPLCRNEDWCKLNVQFTIDVMRDSILIGMFPRFLHPIVGPLISTWKAKMRRAMGHLGEIVKERIRMTEAGEERPNDGVTWLVDMNNQIGKEWQKGSHAVEDIVGRILSINFAAIHTTSTAFTHALYHLAAHPEVQPLLREEVDRVLFTSKEDGGDGLGWTKAGMVQLRVMDSFLKESQRFMNISAIAMTRLAVRPYTFSNGVVIPPGTSVGYAAHAVHQDPEVYSQAQEFIPTRFSDMRAGEESIKHQTVTPTPEWLIFGVGKHACPGRFFAVNEIKSMLVYLVRNWDVRFDEGKNAGKDGIEWEGGYPKSREFMGNVVPNTDVKLLFRKRKVSGSL